MAEVLTESRPDISNWKEMLGLTNRCAPELYELAIQVQDSPYAFDIKKIMRNFETIEGVFCVQNKPEIIIWRQDEEDDEVFQKIYKALWNQGLASLLVKVNEKEIKIYSLLRDTKGEHLDEHLEAILIKAVKVGTKLASLENYVHGVESGKIWRNNSEFFDIEMRIDHVLLDNLTKSHSLLVECEGMKPDEAQAALIQTMFIAYLEDREILTEEFIVNATNGYNNLSELLMSGEVKLYKKFFESLKNKFNGDLFITPCSFDSNRNSRELSPNSMDILHRFREGMEEMQSGQRRFFGYNFKYIPISLISAVYSRFLNMDPSSQRDSGSYFTPLPLVDSVLNQIWKNVDERAKVSGKFLDPACGSGLFLVRCFQKMCEYHCMKENTDQLEWDSLTDIVKRINGYDIDSKAVRVAIFSLYITMLDLAPLTSINERLRRGKFLPKLWKISLIPCDYFSRNLKNSKMDVIIGNPPWKAKANTDEPAIRWCTQHKKLTPYNEISWAFVWKAKEEITKNGLVAFLLPANGFLHNKSNIAESARKLMFDECCVKLVVNYSDLRQQLFEDTENAGALVVFKSPDSTTEKSDYSFEYLVPKADMRYSSNNSITIRRIDHINLDKSEVLINPSVFKQRLWMSWQEMKLFAYLDRMPKLKDFVQTQSSSQNESSFDNRWIIGSGFQTEKANLNDSVVAKLKQNSNLNVVKCLQLSAFNRIFIDPSSLEEWTKSAVRGSGFEESYSSPKILIKKAISLRDCRLHSAYSLEPLSLKNEFHSIKFPKSETNRAKFVIAVLNSRLAMWFAFHTTASIGTYVPRVLQHGILEFPMPEPDFFPDDLKTKATKFRDEIVKAVNRIEKKIRKQRKNAFENVDNDSKFLDDELNEIDLLTYRYFNLSDNEISLINDATNHTIRAVNPSVNEVPDIWKEPNPNEIKKYALKLESGLSRWIKNGKAISVELTGKNEHYGIIGVTLTDKVKKWDYMERSNKDFARVFGEITSNLEDTRRNFQLIPNLKRFIGPRLYLIKPMQFRYWMESVALEDAFSIALEIQKKSLSHNRKMELVNCS